MDVYEMESSSIKHSTESIIQHSAQVAAWESMVMPLLSCMNEMDHLYRKYGEVVLNPLKGKNYLLFVCFYFPPDFCEDFEFDSVYPEGFIPACCDLYSYRDDFEIVLVTKMSADNPTIRPLVYNPFTPFPLYSLFMPFNDSKRRTYICNLLEPDEPVGFGFRFKCLFVNVSEKTLLVGQPDSMSSLVDHLKELVTKSPFDALHSYHRLLKAMWPINTCLPLTPCPIVRLFNHAKPEYSDSINAMVSELPPLQIGQALDVKFLLSGGSNELSYLVRKDGEQVELGKAIQDKYVMICCFHAPVFRKQRASLVVQSLLNTYSELYALRVDFEMVVVVKMKKLADYKQVFDHVLSGFPSSCFVIPFEDLKRRDFICKYLELDDIQCLLLDKKGTDMKKNILLHDNHMFARDYGADAFPFTDEKLQELKADEEPRWKTSSTNNLVGLLRCKTSDVLVKTNAEDGCCDTVTISDLNKKDVVGLFLCVQGNLIPKLQEVYEQCKIQQKPFEILLVYIPFSDSLDPQNHKLYVDNLLWKHKLSLWYMPVDNSVSHKLFRLTDCPIDDQLIIFRAHDASIDPYGGEVMSTYGIDAYPFTREELVQRELNKFKELTWETLLNSRSYLLKGNTEIPVADLRGKNILLWIGSLSVDDMSFYLKLLIWYENNRAKSPDFEVVFVRKHNSTAPDDDFSLSEVMPWVVCPFNADHSASVQKKLFPNGGISDDALVEFGTNGLVCSFTAEDLLDMGVDESGKIPFGRCNLRHGVIKNLRRPLFYSMHNFID